LLARIYRSTSLAETNETSRARELRIARAVMPFYTQDLRERF
jgi:hypothetical protein